MKTTFQIHSNTDSASHRQISGFDISIEAEKTYKANHSFSKDILKIDTELIHNSHSQSDNNTFSDILYQELLNNGMGSKENFERLFQLQ